MSALVNFKHSHVVDSVAKATLVCTLNLSDFEKYSNLVVREAVEMWLKEILDRLSRLVIRDYR